jgi:hypothetical protein
MKKFIGLFDKLAILLLDRATEADLVDEQNISNAELK